ncbi:hypothetical protein F3Y22_tig00006613pilonHSYRG00078 [Hibiscus syriacus]|uniref:Calmodulin binding protein C-terminal domain-containing protein n=1 Tax=Hibiscus syriacus TaxID=106335 RepID=A0A6A3CGZ5_HIBSY|nr:hypothetical protein F3Y22_tig00006613pilonHSYRG00078 [Hibiscus syriacus]
MSEKMWSVTIKHAKTCVMGNKYYVFGGSNCRIWLNPICQILKAEINGSFYPTHNLSGNNKAYFENLVRQAYANWSSLEEREEISNEIGLLTQGDHVVDPYPNHQQTMVRSFQQNAYLTNCSMEGYFPGEMQADGGNWEASRTYFNTVNENGVGINILKSNSEDDLTSPRSFITGG